MDIQEGDIVECLPGFNLSTGGSGYIPGKVGVVEYTTSAFLSLAGEEGWIFPEAVKVVQSSNKKVNNDYELY